MGLTYEEYSRVVETGLSSGVVESGSRNEIGGFAQRYEKVSERVGKELPVVLTKSYG